jgi:hypothetical protein
MERIDPNLLGHDASMNSGSHRSPPKFAFALHPLPDVMDALERHEEGLMLLIGPPGCGKTAAMVQHYQRLVAQSQAPVWVQLPKIDRDATNFIAHLLSAREAAETRRCAIFLDGYEALSPKSAIIVDAFLEDLTTEISCFIALRSFNRKVLIDAALRGHLSLVRPEKFQWLDQDAAALFGERLGVGTGPSTQSSSIGVGCRIALFGHGSRRAAALATQ